MAQTQSNLRHPLLPKGLIGAKCTTQINIAGIKCNCLLDTGSQVTTISQYFYNENLSDQHIHSLNNFGSWECNRAKCSLSGLCGSNPYLSERLCRCWHWSAHISLDCSWFFPKFSTFSVSWHKYVGSVVQGFLGTANLLLFSLIWLQTSVESFATTPRAEYRGECWVGVHAIKTATDDPSWPKHSNL